MQSSAERTGYWALALGEKTGTPLDPPFARGEGEETAARGALIKRTISASFVVPVERWKR